MHMVTDSLTLLSPGGHPDKSMHHAALQWMRLCRAEQQLS